MKILILLSALGLSTQLFGTTVDQYKCTISVEDHNGDVALVSETSPTPVRQVKIAPSNWIGEWNSTESSFNIDFQYKAQPNDEDIMVNVHVFYMYGYNKEEQKAFIRDCLNSAIEVGHYGMADDCGTLEFPEPFDPYDHYRHVDFNGAVPEAKPYIGHEWLLEGDLAHSNFSRITLSCNLDRTVN